LCAAGASSARPPWGEFEKKIIFYTHPFPHAQPPVVLKLQVCAGVPVADDGALYGKDLVELRDVRGRELDGVEVRVEVREFGRARDGRDVVALRAQPGERERADGAADARGDARGGRVDKREIRLKGALGKARLSGEAVVARLKGGVVA